MANKIPIALKGITTLFERIERHQIPKIAVRFFFVRQDKKVHRRTLKQSCF